MFPIIPEALAERAAKSTLRLARERDAERIAHVRWPAEFRRDEAAAILDAAHTGDDALCWIAPHGHDSVVAIAPVVRVTAEGAARFRDLAETISEWRPRISTFADPTLESLPVRFLGGFAFSDSASNDPNWRPYGSAELVLHRWSWGHHDDLEWAAVATRVRPEDSVAAVVERLTERPNAVSLPREAAPIALRMSNDHKRQFVDRVARALDEIDAARFSKVVVARAADFVAERALRPGATVAALNSRFPQCFTFWFGSVERGAFFGATPERLIQVSGKRLRTMALAGSVPAAELPDESKRLAEQLLRSEKDLHEHRVVVDAIVDAVQPRTNWLDVPPEPEVLQLSNIQHLHTPVVGEIADGHDSWTLLDRLHPTPAVGGRPSKPAREFIERYEADTRGWYTGAVGWASIAGDMEFAVALRCGLVKGSNVRLFAGAGIVADSEPEREWEETRQKLQALEPSLAGESE